MRRRALAVAVLVASGLAAAEPPPGKGRTADLSPPQISVSTIPAVATSYSTPISVSYSDDVELAYVRTTSSSPFVFLAESIKTFQSDGVISVELGRTTTTTLLAVDMAGNVAKKTITIASPDVPFKFGAYTITGPNVLPAGFDCRPSWAFPPQPSPGSFDGQSVSSFSIGYAFPSFPPGPSWSVADGFRPMVGLGAFGLISPATNIPLNSMSFTGESGGGSASGQTGFYEYRFRGSAQVVQLSPRTIQVSYNMSCNVNGTGWLNGAAATFTGAFTQ